MDSEDRILTKLDQIDERTVSTLVMVTEIKGEVRQIQDLKDRISAVEGRATVLEKWKWGTIGAIAASGSTLATTIIKAIGG